MGISRRQFLKATLAGGLMMTHSTGQVGAQEARRRPNILFIMTDQQPVATVGAYGNSLARTPNIDRLAQEGALFSNFHIAAFPCSPSRACYFTGMYAHAHGVVNNDVPLREDIPSLGNIFKAAGYQTAYIGKWHLGGNMYVTDESAKWSFRRIDDPNEFKFAKDGPWRGGEDDPQCGFTDKWVGGWRHFRQYLRDVGLGELLEKNPKVGNHNMAPSGPEGTHIYSLVPQEHHEAAFSCKEAEKFIRHERDPSKPFCMVVSIYGPHSPVAPPRPWDELYSSKEFPLPDNHRDLLLNKPFGQRRNLQCYKLHTWTEEQFRDYNARYWAYCAYIDKQIGRVLKALDDTGQAEDTLVIFTSDHGDMVSAHGMILKLSSCGYDELLRVPFIVRYPRVVRPGIRSDALIESVDVLPTILALCGMKPPESVQGRAFDEILRGKAHEFREVIFSEWGNNNLVVRTRDWKYVSNWKQGDLDELYDMNARPLEMENLAADPAHAEQVKKMRGLLCEWLRQTKHPYAPQVSKAILTGTSDKIILEPAVTAFRQGTGKDGQPTAEFEVTWKMLRGTPSDMKYWCFVHIVPHAPVRKRQGNGILTRITKWPDPPTTEWKEKTEQKVSGLAVPIPADMKPGTYLVRTGLYNPEHKKNPPLLGGATVPVGTLRVSREKGGKVAVTFQPLKEK